MAEFKLERFKYTWKGSWTENTAYKRDDVIVAGGRSYVCIVGHTAGDDFADDLYATVPGSNPPISQPKWRLMTGGGAYRGQWVASREYFEGDLVSKDGSVWRAKRANSLAEFTTGKSIATTVTYNVTVDAGTDGQTFNYYFDGIEKPTLEFFVGSTYKFIQDDSSNVYYGGSEELNEPNEHPLLFGRQADFINDDEVYNVGVTYYLDSAKVSYSQYVAGFVNASNREVWITVDEYAPTTLYYFCKFHAGMGTSIDVDREIWELYLDQVGFIGDWTTGINYGPGALAKYNGIVYRCIRGHTAQATLEADTSRWEVFFDGIEYRGPWQGLTGYRKGDLVVYGGSVFKCTITHTSDATALDDTNFELHFPGYQFDGEWSPEVQYNLGDVVRYGGETWYATANNYDSDPYRDAGDSTRNWIQLTDGYNFRGDWDVANAYRPGDLVKRGGNLYRARIDISGNLPDGSTQDYLDNDIWELVQESNNYISNWENDREYLINDVVYYLGSAYAANIQHISTNENFPGDNGNPFDYWDLIGEAQSIAGLSKRGDLLTYDLNRTLQGDTSTLGPTSIDIGEENKILSINDDDEAFWRDYIFDTDVVYVSTTGEDKEGNGLSAYQPFRTIRYAADYILDNFAPYTPAKISVATGRYEEIGPIRLNAGCVVMGDELRSTTIVANPPIKEYEDDFQYLQDSFDYFETIIFNILNNITVDPLPGNNEEQWVLGVPAGATPSNKISALIDDIVDRIGFLAFTGFTNPEVVGTNIEAAIPAYNDAAETLKKNTEFIGEQIYAWLVQTYPTRTWTKSRVKGDWLSFIRGWRNDLKFDSNWYSYEEARRYANAKKGSQNDDMFYCRDTTGIRQCTFDGLTGSLNPPGVFDLYQRPTGGAYVALDPGWGPDDDRTWILKRSPYIQGNTTLGFAAVGMKVDGALHNGGNKSMTANDFTQVISDGVGAWILNNGRAELVSVFTYYAQVGYLAEDGGVIRATNGNNSYGSFGSISDGNDPTETPQSATVDNRNNEATITQAFSGTDTDQILIMEYYNAGEEYTSATGEVTGAGIDADIEFDDFRDGGLYQARLNVPPDSGASGGTGYSTYTANARVTADSTSSILLSLTEDATTEELVGQRIVIIAGDGSGQYGYIQAYNESTNTATIYRESDDQPGWDHVIPGYPIESSLTTNAQYNIEPRLEVDEPPYAADDRDVRNARTFVDGAFGPTNASFNNIEGELGSGDVDGAVPSAAVWDIIRRGKTYTVTLDFAGAGYAVDDTITIAGTDLDGASPENDIVITVTGTTDDSTNAITTFTYEGTGKESIFVLLANPNFIQYGDGSSNGWTEVNLPFAGTPTKIAAGNNKFVVIGDDEQRVAVSDDAATWRERPLQSQLKWSDITYGGGYFVAVASNGNAVAYSSDGESWSEATIPDSSFGDSTGSEWQAVAYGQGKFVALSGSLDHDIAVSTDGGATWTRTTDALPGTDQEGYEITDCVYGAGRFVAITVDGRSFYSLNGTTWYESGDGLPTQDGSTAMNWRSMDYGNGMFFAICDTEGLNIFADPASGPTSFAAVSEDGVRWVEKQLSSTQLWSVTVHGNPNQEPIWLNVCNGVQANGISAVKVGRRAKLRSDLLSGVFQTVKVWDPGSGYDSANPPSTTVTDNKRVLQVYIQERIGNGVLGQPSFLDRGTGYRTASTAVTIEGNGFADNYAETNEVTLSGIQNVPGVGVQIRFASLLDLTTDDPDDLELFNGVTVTDLGDDGSGNGTKRVKFQISPRLRVEDNLEHGTVVTLRERYSQCRITNHDFLDIGTGNFTETNYPELYAGGAFFVAAPENEVLEVNGGRVFYTSTDQDGNFRAGELFSVQQSTGIVTISAEFFDLDGLSELALGGVRLGGSGAVIREFSTDPNFTEDSNNVVPTQRAIATFLSNRLSEGGQDVETNLLIAGQVRIGDTATEQNIIETTTGVELNLPKQMVFEGADAGVGGTMISQMLFLRTFNDTVQ